MRTIILTYPGYQSLPKGIKQMLVASENFYFDEVGSATTNLNRGKPKEAKVAQFPAPMNLGISWKAYAAT